MSYTRKLCTHITVMLIIAHPTDCCLPSVVVCVLRRGALSVLFTLSVSPCNHSLSYLAHYYLRINTPNLLRALHLTRFPSCKRT
jgi:hypothetical protein